MRRNNIVNSPDDPLEEGLTKLFVSFRSIQTVACENFNIHMLVFSGVFF